MVLKKLRDGMFSDADWELDWLLYRRRAHEQIVAYSDKRFLFRDVAYVLFSIYFLLF